ncbi:Scr1 family TA system antitoxin-like transcriptional regulator [Nonomuraea sp. NBC_01738]|uniref:helix-turn-helix domain-containing protein n=1 Tax=Nonomuraea sp. NBC_01738 TaxID=2976003 RepID=UPI002E0FB39A|nr:Scr1 family TA system antitoxin-like transcriptional regulator [Nonomuraea sp. NBC_01738]
MANFAERLDLALSKRGCTGAQVAAALTTAGIPITRAYVSQLRTGKQTNPTLHVLQALAAYLQVSVGWLLGEDYLESGAAQDLQVRAAAIGVSASGLSDGSLGLLREVVDLARRAEGLSGAPAPAGELPAAATLDQAQRTALGGRLRSLRQSARLAAEEVEFALGRGVVAVGPLEEGLLDPAPATIARLLTLYGVAVPQVREHVLALARGERDPGWYDAPTVPLLPAVTYALEERAAVIRTYQAQVVPPLLQTEEYARAAIQVAGLAVPGVTTVDDAVATVMTRQELLTRNGGPVLWAVIDESALMRTIAEPHVQAAQLDALIQHAKQPHISVHIAPLDDPAYLPRTGPFTLLRFADADESDLACAHTVDSDELVTDQAAIEGFHQAFAKLSVITTTRDETLDLLHEHRARLPR